MGLQLSCNDVHVVFGDISIKSLTLISKLVFQDCRNIYRNILLSTVLQFWSTMNTAWINWFYINYSFLSSYFFGAPYLGFLRFLSSFLVFFTTGFDDLGDQHLVESFSFLYRQNKTIGFYIYRICFFILATSIVQACYIINFQYRIYAQLTSSVGGNMDTAMLQLSLFFIVGMITIFRAYFFIGVQNYAALVICCIVVLVLVLYPFVTNYFTPEELWSLPLGQFFLSYKIIMITLIQIVLGLFVEWVISISYQNKYSTPVYSKLEILVSQFSTAKEKIEKLKEYFESEVINLLKKRASYRNLNTIIATGASASPLVREKIL